MTYGCRRETGSKPSKGIARASTAFASMTDGESAFSGEKGDAEQVEIVDYH